MTNLTPGVRNVMQCDRATTDSCDGHGAGHALLPLQERVTAATPSKWRDATVRSVSADGWIALDVLDSADAVWAWHHADLTSSIPVGTPVALHGIYHTLAVGRARHNVLIAAPID
jgi:hypothetical protein